MEPYSTARYQKTLNEAFVLLTQGLFEAKAELRGANTTTPLLEWSIQGLGMLRHYLPGTNQRLHVWSAEHTADDVSAMHSHPWNFTATILSGHMENEVYTSGSLVGESKPYQRQTIFCGKGGGLVGEPSEVWLGMESAALYTPGQRYRMEAPQIHVSKPTSGCVTLCDREQVGDPDHAEVFWPLGKVWGSAEPRPATAEERSSILGYALEVWGVRPS